MAKKNERIYYSMGEAAEMLDVKPSLIRFWEKKFDILRPHKNKKGNRLFSPEDMENLKLIYHLVKENGMTLAGAQKRMKESRGELTRDMEVVERLHSIRSLLMEISQELKDGGTIEEDTDWEENGDRREERHAAVASVSAEEREEMRPEEAGGEAEEAHSAPEWPDFDGEEPDAEDNMDFAEDEAETETAQEPAAQTPCEARGEDAQKEDAEEDMPDVPDAWNEDAPDDDTPEDYPFPQEYETGGEEDVPAVLFDTEGLFAYQGMDPEYIEEIRQEAAETIEIMEAAETPEEPPQKKANSGGMDQTLF